MLELGCDSGQGYFFGRPMAREAVAGCIDHDGRLTSGKRSSGSGDVGMFDDSVEAVVPTVGVPLVVAQITERRDYTPGLDDKFKEVALDRMIGPPAVLNDPLVPDRDHPAPASHDLDGMGHA